jgi:hypothetical protein
MLYEVAITAVVFDRFGPTLAPLTNQALIQVLHGVRRNGVLANLFSGGWWPEVNKKASGLDQSIRFLVHELLNQLHDRGQIIDRPKHLANCPRTDAQWLEESIASHGWAEFYAIITKKTSLTSYHGPPACVLALEEILLSDHWNGRKTSRWVSRTTSSFKAALNPLLSTARSVRLADAHIGYRIYRGNLEFLRGLSVIDGCAAPLPRRAPLSLCEIHTLDHDEIPTNQYGRIALQIATAMPGIAACCKRKLLYVWKERKSGKKFHNRRIITNQTTVSVPWGLDIHEGPGESPGNDEWSLLDDDVATEIAKDFQLNSSPYDMAIAPIPW